MPTQRYGITFPFVDSQEGFFLGLNSFADSEIKSNLIHLILTQKGSRYFLPAFGLNNLKFSIVAQTIKNSYLNKFFLKIRTLKNVEIIFKEEGKEKMLEALKNKVHLGLASDQNAGNKGDIVSLLKSEISIPKGAAIFHLKTKRPIFVGYCIMNKNLTYDFKLEKLNTHDIDHKKTDCIKKINQRFAKSLEEMIIKYPNQYFWFHKMKNKADYNK